jgi:hypothetical protein
MRRFLLRAFLPSPAVIAAIAAFIATLAQPNNPDTLWHLAVGKWIFFHHSIPDISSFYYSATTGFGYDYSWLSQAVLFGAYQWLGGAGVAILNSVVAGFIFYLLYKLMERNSTNMLVNFAVLGLALMTTTAYLSGRPVMFTVAFLTLEILILSRFVHRSSFIAHRSSRLWLIPPMTALWANLHPGFAVAPLLILLFLPLARKARDRWTLAACLAATGIAVIFNPYGWRMYLMPLEIARSMSALRGLTEWTSVSGWEAVVWGSLVALVTCGLSLRRQPFPVILLVALSALAAGLSSRNMPLFGVIAVFVLGRTLLRKKVEVEVKVEKGVISSASAYTSAFLRKFDVKFATTGGWVWATAIPLLLIVASRSSLIAYRLSFDLSGYPTAAVRYIEEHGRPGNLFVRETWSGYLLWATPDRKLFYDAKGGFSREAAADHSELVKPKAGWRGVAERNGVSTFLLERGSPLAVVLSEAADWRREYSDSLAEVFVRRPEAAARPGSTDSSEAHASLPPY